MLKVLYYRYKISNTWSVVWSNKKISMFNLFLFDRIRSIKFDQTSVDSVIQRSMPISIHQFLFFVFFIVIHQFISFDFLVVINSPTRKGLHLVIYT